MPVTIPSEAELRRKLSIYYVADPEQVGHDILGVVDEAIAGGATSVQLRTKHTDGREMFNLAVAMVRRCQERDVLFFVNDRVDIGIACGADGVHVGAKDLPLPATRALTGDSMIIGYSPVDASDAASGADYVGLGPVFGTQSKDDAQPELGLMLLSRQVTAARIPSVGIGGITIANAGSVIRAGVDGVAVISAIQGADDPKRATESLALTVNLALIER
jgi:thiamine-phosphate pyrophosphorylase